MTSTKRLLAVAAVAGATAFTSFSSDAFFGPFSWMRGGGWGPGWWGALGWLGRSILWLGLPVWWLGIPVLGLSGSCCPSSRHPTVHYH